MKSLKLKLFLIATTTLSMCSASWAQTITSFTSSGFNYESDFSLVSGFSASTESFSFSGTGESTVFGYITPTVNNGGSFSALMLNASITTYTPPATTFFIDLYDADFDYITFQGNFSGYSVSLPTDFLASYTSQSLTGGGNFDGEITSIYLRLGSAGGTVNMTLNDLTAVPEPAAFAAFAGLGVLSWAIVRRRKVRTA